MEELLNWLLAFTVILGIFLATYMSYKHQGLIETFQEIKEMFEDKAEEAKELVAYK